MSSSEWRHACDGVRLSDIDAGAVEVFRMHSGLPALQRKPVHHHFHRLQAACFTLLPLSDVSIPTGQHGCLAAFQSVRPHQASSQLPANPAALHMNPFLNSKVTQTVGYLLTGMAQFVHACAQ